MAHDLKLPSDEFLERSGIKHERRRTVSACQQSPARPNPDLSIAYALHRCETRDAIRYPKRAYRNPAIMGMQPNPWPTKPRLFGNAGFPTGSFTATGLISSPPEAPREEVHHVHGQRRSGRED